MAGIPTGTVTFTGQAISGGCAALGTGAIPVWTSDPVTAQVSPGATVDVALVMHRNGQANVHIDFRDDSGGGTVANQASTATALPAPPALQQMGGVLVLVQGQTVTFDAPVTVQPPGAGTPTGTVVFDFTGALATSFTSPLAGGTASTTVTFSAPGQVVLFASYTGDAAFAASVSPALRFEVVDQLPQTGACAPPSGGVSWWHADQSFLDSLGNNDATPVGNVTFAPGVRGSGFFLDGTDYVQVPDSPSLDFTAGLTIDAWVNTATGFGRIFDKITRFAQDGFLMDVIDGGRLRMQVGTMALDAPAPLTPNTFVHVAGTFDGARLALFVNGQLQAETPSSQGPVPTNALPLRLGADSGGNSIFDGVIDEPRIFDRALTDAEVNTLFVQGTTCP